MGNDLGFVIVRFVIVIHKLEVSKKNIWIVKRGEISTNSRETS